MPSIWLPEKSSEMVTILGFAAFGGDRLLAGIVAALRCFGVAAVVAFAGTPAERCATPFFDRCGARLR